MIKQHCSNCKCFSKTLFKRIDKENLSILCDNKTLYKYKKGQSIFTQVTKPSGIFCVNKGKLVIFKTGIYGKEQILRFVLPGELLGIASFFNEKNHSISVMAFEDSQLCYIAKEDFQTILNKHQGIYIDIINLLSNLLNEANEKITSLTQKNVRERLAETLYNLNYLFKPDDNIKGKQFTEIRLSRQDLANLVGTATESVIRHLSEFKKENIISINGRKITILNPEELYKISN